MVLVRTYEQLRKRVRQRIGSLVAYLTKDLRGYDRLREFINKMEEMYHWYRKVKRREVNLFVVGPE